MSVMSWPVLRRVGAMLILGTGLAGSLAPHAARGASIHVSGSMAAGTILRIADEGENDLPSIDPPSPSAGDAQSNLVEGLIFGGLTRLDDRLRVQPNAASSWTISRDGRVYTFTLRRGLRFADGTPVTAADVVWSFNRAFSPAFASGNTGYYLSHIVGGLDVTNKKARSVRGIKGLGSDRVQITLDAPEAVILDQLAYSVADIVPRHLVTRGGTRWTEHAAGLGPFMVKQWKHGQEIDLAPNPYYWRGKPKVGGLNMLFVQDAGTAFNLYRTGAVDVMGAIHFPNSRLHEMLGTPDLHEKAQLFTEYLTPSEHKAPFDNVLVRRAFSYAINRATIAKLLQNRILPASGILPPGMPGYDPSAPGQTFNPALAVRLLAQAGYPGGKGLPKISLAVDGGDADGQTKAIALRTFWKRVLGVEVTLNSLEHGAYNNALTARNYQLAFIAWGADYPDPQNFLSLQLQTGAPNNNGSYSNATFDSLTRRADVLVGNNAQRLSLYRQAERLAVNDAAWIVLDWNKADILIRPSVHGLVVNGLGLTAPNWADVTK